MSRFNKKVIFMIITLTITFSKCQETPDPNLCYDPTEISQPINSQKTYKDTGDKIINGEVVKEGEAPWMVSLSVTYYHTPMHKCGGVIVADKWVITAAHCVYNERTRNLLVIAGEYNLTQYDKTEQVRCVRRYFIHPEFDLYTRQNDIALLMMKTGFFFSENRIMPIIFYREPTPYTDEMCKIYGWGSISEGGLNSEVLLLTNQTVWNSNDCYSTLPSLIHSDMFCANNGVSGPCMGDWGGPLVCRGSELAGIASWAVGCSFTSMPAVYTNATYFYSWIDYVIENHYDSSPHDRTLWECLR